MADLMSKIRGFGGEDGLKAGEADWTTGMALFKPDESRTGEALSSGRKSGSVGWGGAAGTEYWIDPVSKIAVGAIASVG
jgi:CubicO group peptidase (beta-lactamase class C family)